MKSTARQIKRLGGELPAFSDRLGAARPWQPNWLAFSHGRAAIAWLLERRAARGALVCAYTCPTLPAFLRRRGLALAFYDIGASPGEIAAQARTLPAPRMVVIPALFGSRPLLRMEAVDSGDYILVDAAQSAFGHAEIAPPAGGAVLSCPRKAAALADGAVLSLAEGLGTSSETRELPPAVFPAAMKARARALWAGGDPALEPEALSCNRRSEESWPDAPHRMSAASFASLGRIDRQWHESRRRRNREALASALSGLALWAADQGTPFNLPVFAADPKAVLAHLHRSRIFASALWPDAELDASRHPAAAWIARHLVSLPVDQRHDEADMQRIAAAMAQLAAPPPGDPPASLRGFVTRR